MDIIEQIGAYAGLASVVGLAVLAALYFSQARDVKRLREWAGRAPERGAVPGVVPPHQRVVAQPQRTPPVRVPSPAAAVAQGTAKPGPPRPPGPPPPPGAPTSPPAPPAGAPAPARAAAPGAAPPAVAGPATAAPAAATPAAARVAAGEDRAGDAEDQKDASQDTMVHPPPSPAGEPEAEDEREVDVAAAPPGDEDADGERAAEEQDSHEEEPEYDEDEHEPDLEYDEDEEADEDGAAALEVPAVAQAAPPPPPSPPRPAIPYRPPPPIPTRAGSPPRQGPILPPYEQSRPGGDEPWYRRGLASRAGVVAVGTTLFVVALVAVALFQLGGDEKSEPAKEQGAPNGDSGAAAKGETKRKRSPVVPGRVTVSVLNGTTVGGLARDVGDKLQGQGFRLGNVTNSTDQQRAESVVLYATGAEREAAEVGRRLNIDQREPIDPESQTLAGDATVVVIAGGDRAP